MECFTVFDPATGRILRSGYCAPDDVALQAQPGEKVIQAASDGASHYVDVSSPPAYAVVAMPARPSVHAVWEYTARQWEDQRTLADHQLHRWAAIKESRDAAIQAPLLTPFGMFDADVASQTKITQGVLLANNLVALGMPVQIDFTLADNTQVVLTAAQMVQVGLTLAGREQQIRAVATALRAQINQATTPEAVAAVAWPEVTNP